MGKTRKNKYLKGIVILEPNDNDIDGKIMMKETKDGIKMSYEINGLKDGDHGFHIHKFGDLSDGCKSAGPHFNPYGYTHGGLDSPKNKRHLGDLGNITSINGLSKGQLLAPDIKLCGGETSVYGRMLVIHSDKDDLGQGVGKERKESLITGNAGKRLACGIIARC